MTKVELKHPLWLKLLGIVTLFITLLYAVFAGVATLYFYFFGTTINIIEDNWGNVKATIIAPGGDIWPLIVVFTGFLVLAAVYGGILGVYKGWFDEEG